jgi:hypothetical protein
MAPALHRNRLDALKSAIGRRESRLTKYLSATKGWVEYARDPPSPNLAAYPSAMKGTVPGCENPLFHLVHQASTAGEPKFGPASCPV